MIPFNKPFLTGKETDYITDAVVSGKYLETENTQKCVKIILKINSVSKKHC